MASFVRISPRLFLALSLVLVSMMVAGTGHVLSQFFRQAIIDREGKIVADLAHALAAREITPNDIVDFRQAEAQAHLDRGFGIVRQLGEVVRIKVFDLSGTIVWSDTPILIGTRATRHDDVRRAAAGGSTVIFYEEAGDPRIIKDRTEPERPVVEFYVPVRVRESAEAPFDVVGVMALYRSAASLNATLRRGVVLIWLVTAGGGIVLFGALFILFQAVYRGRQEAESRLSRLSSEHQRIIHLEKLSATGAMVGEIAHQINNPLVGVINLAQLAEREADDPVRTRALLADIRKAGEHCRDFVRRMLVFTKAARYEPQPTALAPLVGETVALFQSSTPGQPAVSVHMPDGDTWLSADPVLLRHALFNLLNNAQQAAPGAGIEVEVRRESPAGSGRDGWLIVVRDHGPGVPMAMRQHIFTPFFTTKSGGVGLGLSVVEQIVVRHGGEIAVDDAEGGGASFTIRLPIRTEEGGAPPP